MIDTLAPIEELQRIPSPAPAPQALACDGNRLWMGSRDTKRLYCLNAHTGAVLEETTAPGIPWAAVVTGDELRVTCGEGEADDRYIRRYIFGHGFKTNERIACPDFTGSYLGYDGEWLYLSQFYNGRILQLDSGGAIQRAIPIDGHISGFVFVDELLYVIHGNEDTCDWRLARLDPHGAAYRAQDLAAIPFQARSLSYDGTRFWTNYRAENQIVAFSKPA